MSNRISNGEVLVGSLAADGAISAGGDATITGDLSANSLTATEPGVSQGGISFSVAGSTAVTTSFQFPNGSVIHDVVVKITSVAATSGSISIGLCTGASSSGNSTGLINAMLIGTTGTYLACPSTSHPTLSFSYGSYFISTTSEAVTILKDWIVGSTDTYRYLNYTSGTTAATAGVIYPIFTALS